MNTRFTDNAIGGRCGCVGGALIMGLLAAFSAAAQPYIRWDCGATVGAVNKISIAPLKNNWVVTAARNSDNNLQMISWRYGQNGLDQITKKEVVVVTGGINDIKLTGLDASHVLAAMINNSGNLQVRVWDVDSSGHFTRQGTAFGGPTTSVNVMSLSASQAVTAAIDTSGNLIVSVWGIDTSGNIMAQGSVTDVAVTQAAIAKVSSTQVLVAARNAAGKLLLESWSVNSTGTVTFQSEHTGNSILQVDVSSYNTGNTFTGLQNGSGKIQVSMWNVDSSGNITRTESATAEAIQQVAISGSITAAEDSSGNLSVGFWTSFGNFYQTSLTHGTANLVDIAPLGGNLMATASRDSSGNLEVNVLDYGVIK